MERIRYIVHYDTDDEEGRTYTPSGVRKADYICHALNRAGYRVDILAAGLMSKRGFRPSSRTAISENTRLIRLPAFPWSEKNPVIKGIAHLWNMLALFVWFCFHLKKDEPVLVYHTLLSVMAPLRLAKKIRGFRIVLEVEEIYTDILSRSARVRRHELRFIREADRYIFSSVPLARTVNTDGKPFAVAHGSYIPAPPARKAADGHIHLVYAGILSPEKGIGTVLKLRSFLPDTYIIHILGFGTAQDVSFVKEAVASQNNDALRYDGFLSGKALSDFLSGCDIGLCLQSKDAAYNDTAFPSKLLTYLSCGLAAVTPRTEAVASSAIAEYVTFYENEDPAAIAEVICHIDLAEKKDGRALLCKLDADFCRELRALLEGDTKCL